jgi:hypothetical protein
MEREQQRQFGEWAGQLPESGDGPSWHLPNRRCLGCQWTTVVNLATHIACLWDHEMGGGIGDRHQPLNMCNSFGVNLHKRALHSLLLIGIVGIGEKLQLPQARRAAHH